MYIFHDDVIAWLSKTDWVALNLFSSFFFLVFLYIFFSFCWWCVYKIIRTWSWWQENYKEYIEMMWIIAKIWTWNSFKFHSKVTLNCFHWRKLNILSITILFNQDLDQMLQTRIAHYFPFLPCSSATKKVTVVTAVYCAYSCMWLLFRIIEKSLFFFLFVRLLITH